MMEDNEDENLSADKDDSLFSFELYVHSIHNVTVECSLPAVAFRLLDFPSLIIYQTDRKNIKALCDSGRNSVEKSKNEISSLYDNQSYNFGKGKSSLFSMGFNKLYSLLSNVPVYTMLLDAVGTKSKLLGSCSISLKLAIEELMKHVKPNGFVMPSNYKKNVKLNVFNLMGTVIAQLNVTYTLYSYGNSLSNHVRSSKLQHLEMYYKDRIKVDKNGDDLNIGKLDKPLKSEKLAEKIRKIDVATETMLSSPQKAGKYEDKDIFCEEQRTLLNGGESLPAKDKAIDSKRDVDDYVSQAKHDFQNGVFCPPPMFYKSVKMIDNVQNKKSEIDFTNNSKQISEHSDRKMFINDFKSSGTEEMQVYQTKVLNSNDYIYHEVNQPFEHQEKAQDAFDKTSSTVNSKIKNVPDSTQQQELGKLYDVIASLNGLPLLQGILKEIVNFGNQFNYQAPNDKLAYALHDKSVAIKPLDHDYDNASTQRKSGFDNQSKKVIDKPVPSRKATQRQMTLPQKRRIPKKLKFKTTRTQEMRCALNSGSRRLEQNQSSNALIAVSDENKKNLNQRFLFQSNNQGMEIERKQVRHTLAKNNNIRYHNHSESRSDSSSPSSHSRESVHFGGIVSKSPVSLEIRLPSAADAAEVEFPVEDSYQANSAHSLSSFEQSRTNTPEPLKRKWVGNQDLSKIEGSLDTRNEYSRENTRSSSRVSELEKLISASDENVSFHTPVGSVGYDQPNSGENSQRKSEGTNNYSADDFDDATESSHSHAGSSVLKESSESNRSFPSDSLNSKPRSSRLSYSSKATVSGNKSLSDASRTFKSDDDKSKLHETESARTLSRATRSDLSSNLTGADNKTLTGSRSLSIGPDRNSRADSPMSKQSVISHDDVINASDQSQMISPKSKHIYHSDIDSSRKSTISQSSLSKNSFPRNKGSDVSRPVASVHSPTTSRSQRNKIQFSQASNGDVTRSIDLSKLSLNTDSEYDSIDMDELDRELQSPDAANKRGDANMAP